MGMTYHHYYDEVAKFRAAIGLKQDDPATHDKLYQEEAAELGEACRKAAVAKTREERRAAKAEYADALADMLIVWCGKDVDIGVPMDDTYRFFDDIWHRAMGAGIYLAGAFRKVIASNYTKIGSADNDAATVAKFDALEIEFYRVDLPNGGVAYYSAADQTGTDGKDYPKHKLLKPAHYEDPKWHEDGWEAN